MKANRYKAISKKFFYLRADVLVLVSFENAWQCRLPTIMLIEAGWLAIGRGDIESGRRISDLNGIDSLE
ncbi:MAG: hypothetical protein BZ151_04225 [Desulfobacca sp. 4484_104]|nr:MAG: hypothetical protein BZ151_04225 [Desulfobacca sp. 4484_104]RLA87883.1 MAG: hypothetical protein DRG58_09590 [Deltaproteobacteria bacterium]